MTYQDTILAASPFRYWPLNETSGTNANELVANEDATASGMTMGGAVGVDGIGGVAPNFTGSSAEMILLRNAALLGGEAEYTVEIWGYYTPLASTDIRALYGEIGTAGNDQIRVGAKGSGSSASLRHVYGHDGASATNDSAAVALSSRWVLYHYTRAASGILTAWWQAGRRMSVTGSTTNTWTNAGLKAALGQVPRSGLDPWRGRLAHCAIYKRVLTQAEMWAHYLAGTPDSSLNRVPTTRNWWKPIKSPWRQRLDQVGNPPTVVAGSVQPARLANQVTAYGAATQAGGGPLYVVDNTTPKQRVRIEGGQNNVSLNHPDLYNAFGNVPIPAAAVVGPGTDAEFQVYNEDTDELWEFWVAAKTLMRPEFVTAAISGAGTIPAGSYYYGIAAEDAGGFHGVARQATPAPIAVSGSQAVLISWGTSEDAARYQVWRHITGDANWHVIATVDASVHSILDDGSLVAGTGFPSSAATAVTADWGCQFGGYISATDDSVGVYEPPHQNWGASATSLPLWAGTISMAEAVASVTDVDAIQHAIAMAVNNTASAYVYPAQRNDFFSGSNNITEGTRFQLDPAFDINTLTNTFAKALAKAFQVFGGIIRDHSAAVTGAYVEDATGLGRDPYPYAFGGKQSYEVLAGFPWSSMRVIDPTWTLTESLPPPNLIETLTDDFADGSIDSSKWVTATNATETGSTLHLTPVGAGVSTLKSIGGGGAVVPWTLQGSSVRAKFTQVAHSTADQSYLRISSQYELTHCRIEFWVDQTVLRFSYTSSAWARTDVATAIYNPAVHVWWKVTESGGVISAYTSTDGVAWTLFGSFVWSVTGWSAINLTNIIVELLCTNFNGTAGRPDFVIDSFNLGPPVVPITFADLVGVTVNINYPGGVESSADLGITVGVN